MELHNALEKGRDTYSSITYFPSRSSLGITSYFILKVNSSRRCTQRGLPSSCVGFKYFLCIVFYSSGFKAHRT